MILLSTPALLADVVLGLVGMVFELCDARSSYLPKHPIRQLQMSSAKADVEALREIENTVGIYDSVVRTGNDTLDVILTEKGLICEHSGIHLTCITDGEKKQFYFPKRRLCPVRQCTGQYHLGCDTAF